MTTPKLTRPIIEAAIVGFESQREKLAEQIAGLRALLNGQPGESTAATPAAPKRGRGKMSAAARARIAAAQRKRWAESRKQGKASTKSVAPKRKRKLSAAGRRAISEATKRRWALKRSEAVKA